MRVVVGVFYFAFLIAVTWPGMLPFNRISPRFMGLPFSFAWPALWVVASFFVLVLLDRSEDPGDDGEGN